MCHDEAKDDATWLAKEVQEGQTFRKHTTDHMLPTLFSPCTWTPGVQLGKVGDLLRQRLLETKNFNKYQL